VTATPNLAKAELLRQLIADLSAETKEFERLIADLSDNAWSSLTPAEPWTVLDQVTHLAYFDESATLAATDPTRFRREAAVLEARGDDYPDQLVQQFATMSPREALRWFRAARATFIATFTTLDPDVTLPWYGPDMAPASSVTARLMETWAHKKDVADALGTTIEATARIKHIAHLGVRTFAYSFSVHGEPVPSGSVFVELEAPDGSRWCWGPPDAPDRISGAALDFVLVVTQRAHRDDTALVIAGPVATAWMSFAQAFAGAAGSGRARLDEPADIG
jgi:uncharacterized protein (TIGR03084 family)